MPTDNENQSQIPGETVQATPSPEVIVKKKKTIKWLWIGVAAVVLVVLIRIGFGGEKELPRSDVGRIPKVRGGDPTTTPDPIAEQVKAREAEVAEKMSSDPKYRAELGSHVPTVTKEFDDPLSEHAVAATSMLGQKPADTKADDEFGEDTEVAPVIRVEPPKIDATPRQEVYEPIAPLDYASDLSRQSSGSGSDSNARNDLLTRLAGAMRPGNGDGKGSSPFITQGVKSQSGSPAPESSGAASAAPGAATTDKGKTATVLARMGTVLYAVTDFELNSDSDNFVQATVISGNYRGSKVQGSFKRQQDKRLGLTFDRIATKMGTLQMSGVALDPVEEKAGVVTEVNNHYWSRIGGILAASVIKGVGQQKAAEGNTVTISAGGTAGAVQTTVPRRSTTDYLLIGAGEAADDAGEIILENTKRPPTIIVKAGTEIAIALRNDLLLDETAKSFADRADDDVEAVLERELQGGNPDVAPSRDD